MYIKQNQTLYESKHKKHLRPILTTRIKRGNGTSKKWKKIKEIPKTKRNLIAAG